ncbi:hypothetical protein IFR04_009317 [Cadophora malorum]|uniref:Uncharacterized protein n=1 Tax=Cadophora malorum TaxID=108018 RepID=A0A8H7TE83_9HELO|nr:hypothetical protein IFR04_009317 [Cadophora malorum]
MHFRNIASVAILAASLVSAIIIPEVPFDGVWIAQELADGTTITTSISNPDTALIISHYVATNKPRVSRNIHGRRFAWPDGDCWGYQLDHAGVDQAANGLADWATNGGHNLCSSDDGTYTYFVNRRNTIVYYCIDAPRRCGNLDTNDVRYALGQMDAHCPRYEASWFKWPGSVEIVGKAKIGDEICI